jgi:adenosylmethionine-8-amino-7-oxononanoate aminotransferase
MAVGKSISGGYSPIGAALLNNRVYDCVGRAEFDHTYTYNPNVDGISAISAVLDKLSQNVFDTDQLTLRTSQLLNELQIPFRNQGLCFDLIIDMNEVVFEKFKDAGFSFNILTMESIPLMIPIIADDEYFEFLKIGLSKVYEI